MNTNFPFDLTDKISLSPEAIADFIFFLAAALTATMSIILFFHWRKYALNGIFMAIMELIYLGVSVVLLVMMFFSLN